MAKEKALTAAERVKAVEERVTALETGPGEDVRDDESLVERIAALEKRTSALLSLGDALSRQVGEIRGNLRWLAGNTGRVLVQGVGAEPEF